MFLLKVFFLVGTMISAALAAAVAVGQIDCQKPPQLDPSQCCQDGGRDEIAEQCAQRYGLAAQSNDAQPPTVEAATCLAECILTESHYMQAPEQLSLEIIQADLNRRFSNDSVYVDTLVDSFRKCEPHAQRKMQLFRQAILASAGQYLGQNQLQQQQQQQRQQPQQQQQQQQQRKVCSPFSGIVLGCAYMEYFKNCPVHRWIDNEQCDLAKQFVTQCSLGA